MNASYHFYRWILPIISIVPVIVGFIGVYAVSGPPDQKAGAAMILGFCLFPISLVLALISAGIVWARWQDWTQVDRVIGVAPLCLLLALALVVVISVITGH